MKKWEFKSDSGLQYLHLPAQVKSAGRSPALLVLHGVGSNERDLTGLAESFDPRFAIFSLRGPLVVGPAHYAWFHVNFTEKGPQHNQMEAESSRKILKSFIENLRHNPEIDPDQIFVMGFSQGAIMGLSLTLTEPELLKGVIALSGRTLQEIAAQSQQRTYHVAPQVLLIHGRQDGKLSYNFALNSEAVLKAAHIAVDFKSYDAGHEITKAMAVDIQKWLSKSLD